ncbi:hypothetical protein BN2476_420097 [Paraburkholderia piptadeniae]|uniref:Uncharacterized protein n=1 Tax=Paraburkholderia piptadeniae TaxID=1701573 RepID=A0A1N7SB96_9BURK|nr:hypothetical protein BN2476_420097 [Paraburkholderia piptadeniae]
MRKIFRKTGLNFDLTLPLNSQTRYRNAVCEIRSNARFATPEGQLRTGRPYSRGVPARTKRNWQGHEYHPVEW